MLPLLRVRSHAGRSRCTASHAVATPARSRSAWVRISLEPRPSGEPTVRAASSVAAGEEPPEAQAPAGASATPAAGSGTQPSAGVWMKCRIEGSIEGSGTIDPTLRSRRALGKRARSGAPARARAEPLPRPRGRGGAGRKERPDPLVLRPDEPDREPPQAELAGERELRVEAAHVLEEEPLVRPPRRPARPVRLLGV